MVDINVKCGVCGLKFKVSIMEEEFNMAAIPCPGCGELELCETDEDADIVLISRRAECGGGCAGCSSREKCGDANK